MLEKIKSFARENKVALSLGGTLLLILSVVKQLNDGETSFLQMLAFALGGLAFVLGSIGKERPKTEVVGLVLTFSSSFLPPLLGWPVLVVGLLMVFNILKINKE